ncbi:hypothetical protein CF326_g5376 [Tilletia indica]|nr:hypothetical protein CF326_g5376 [Tilletia indica]
MVDENKKADVPPANPAVEEDLDDLDDVLDEFNKSSTTAKPVPASLAASKSSPATASSSTAAAPAPSSDKTKTAAVEDEDEDDEDGMPDLNEDELMRGFEEMMAAMGLGPQGAAGATAAGAGPGAAAGARAAPGASAAAGAGAGAGGAPADFAETIRQTMAKLRESDTNASSSGPSGGADGLGMPSEEELAKIFSALGGAEGGGEGEPELAGMLESMMGELLSKDILYEPLKELRDKYPEYFASPAASSISAEDRARYEAQHRFVSEVVAVFEDPAFDNGTEEEKKAKKAQVQELMDSMQECGQPPKEVVGDMPPELDSLGLGGGGQEQCCIQ